MKETGENSIFIKVLTFIGRHCIALLLTCFLTLWCAQKTAAQSMDSDQIESLLTQANNGNVEVQYLLASAYDKGWAGLEKKPNSAAQWYKRAASSGYAKAQFQLARKYHDGSGFTQNIQLARKWYLKAAQQGDADAQINLGYMYNIGQGVSRDDSKAFYWYKKAAVSGEPTAQHNLALLYQYGHGITQNSIKAKYWLDKSRLSAPRNDFIDTQMSIESALKAIAKSTTKPTVIQIGNEKNTLSEDLTSLPKSLANKIQAANVENQNELKRKDGIEIINLNLIKMPADLSLMIPKSKPYQFINQTITIRWKTQPIFEFRYMDVLFTALIFFVVIFVIYPHIEERRKSKHIKSKGKFANHYFEYNRKILRMTYLRYPDLNKMSRSQKEQWIFAIVVLIARYVVNETDKKFCQLKITKKVKKGLRPSPLPAVILLLPIAHRVHALVLQDMRCIEHSEKIPRSSHIQFSQAPESQSFHHNIPAQLKLV